MRPSRRLRFGLAGAIAGMVALSLPALAALPPVGAWPLRTTTNGHAAVVVDEAAARVQDFWLHLYRHAAPGQTTADVLFDACFGLRVGGKSSWAPGLAHPAPAASCTAAGCVADDAVFGFVGATGLVRDVRQFQGVQATTTAFAPQGFAAQAMVLALRVVNPGPQAVAVEPAALLNAHVGPGAPEADSTGERIRALSPRAAIETGSATPHRLLFRAIDGVAAWQAPAGPGSPIAIEVLNPHGKWLAGQALGGATDSGIGADRVAGLHWPPVTLAPGGEATWAVLVLYGANATDADLLLKADAWLAGRLAAQIVADELAGWQAWQAKVKLPAGLAAAHEPLLRRLLAQLRMGQVREPDFGPPASNQTPHGQIVASLPPGIWNITWPRDQAYAALALTAAGLTTEARAALEFVLQGQTGGYTAQVGGPYLVSPTRYFGGGLEESDSNENGPNIELDNTGLVLWQAARYVAATGDAAWLAARWPTLRAKAADLLVKAVDATGLVRADSSIWEVHWNGQQKHFAYTSLLAVRGLCGAAQLALAAGDAALVTAYRKAAQCIRTAVVAKLVGPDGVLRGNLEEPPAQALDAAAVEAFLDGTLDPGGKVAQATWAAWQAKLSAGGGPGLIRNDDGGAYDSQEWLFVDLRVARMLQRMQAAGIPAAAAPAQAILERALAVTRAGGGVVPELVATEGAQAGQFSGAVPMMGFGAGVLALALGGEAWGDDLTACFEGAAAPAGDAGGAADAGSDPEVAGGLDAGGPADGTAGDVPSAADAAASAEVDTAQDVALDAPGDSPAAGDTIVDDPGGARSPGVPPPPAQGCTARATGATPIGVLAAVAGCAIACTGIGMRRGRRRQGCAAVEAG